MNIVCTTAAVYRYDNESNSKEKEQVFQIWTSDTYQRVREKF